MDEKGTIHKHRLFSVAAFKILFNVCVKTLYAIFNRIFPQYKDISGEIILITGGGRGLGRQLALEFSKYRPKHIILWGRNEEWLKRTKDDILTTGVEASYFVCDVSVREQIYQTAAEVRSVIGDVTILVNNAGVVTRSQILDMQDENIIQTVKVNTLAHMWTTKAFLPSMLSKDHGHVVCMCSLLGMIGMKGICDYVTTKFATTGFMESLVLELEDYPGIHTTIIHPYQVDNEMFSGAKIRFPRLFPTLKEDSVTKQAVGAVLTNRRHVSMPLYFIPILFLRSILPTSCLLPTFKFFGLDKLMDTPKEKNQEGPARCSTC